jgi:hypothetical protein
MPQICPSMGIDNTKVLDQALVAARTLKPISRKGVAHLFKVAQDWGKKRPLAKVLDRPAF